MERYKEDLVTGQCIFTTTNGTEWKFGVEIQLKRNIRSQRENLRNNFNQLGIRVTYSDVPFTATSSLLPHSFVDVTG